MDTDLYKQVKNKHNLYMLIIHRNGGDMKFNLAEVSKSAPFLTIITYLLIKNLFSMIHRE
jgi:hypothetical protein